MTLGRRIMRTALVVLAVSPFAALERANAAGTAAGTTISNQATVSYTVGGAPQTPVVSAPVTFVVDNVVDMTLTETSGDATGANPNQTNVATAFTLTNTGNKSQQFRVAAANQATGAASPFGGGHADGFDVDNIRLYIDDGDTPNAFDASDTLIATNLVTLAADESMRILVVADIPITATNGQAANVELSAFATNDGVNPVVATAGADDPNVEDIVVDDGAGAAVDQYLVAAATLSVVKTATVLSDPVNNATNPKAIPGAVIEYVITIQNTGGATAQGVSISDALDANVDFAATGAYSGEDIEIVVNGVTTTCTANSGDGDGCAVVGDVLTIDAGAGIDIPASQQAEISFQVTIS